MSLVPKNQVDTFIATLVKEYEPYRKMDAEKLKEYVFATKPGAGASGACVIIRGIDLADAPSTSLHRYAVNSLFVLLEANAGNLCIALWFFFGHLSTPCQVRNCEKLSLVLFLSGLLCSPQKVLLPSPNAYRKDDPSFGSYCTPLLTS